MWDIERPWWQQGSYQQPVNLPAAAPDDEPLVCIPINRGWIPYLVGAAFQLAQPSSWVGDDAAQEAAAMVAERLIEIIGTAGACMMIRWSTADCAIQQSTDGGATWTDISGWSLPAVSACVMNIRWNTATCSLQYSNDDQATWHDVADWSLPGIAGCLQGPLIDIGGAGGGGTVTPPNPQGVSTLQQACNIAGFLASTILQGSMSQAATAIGSSATLLQGATSVIGIAASLSGLGAAAYFAAGVFFAAAGAIGQTALATAAADATLQSDLTCAIYGAISADGHVTATNFSAAATAINGVTYGTPGIIGLLHDYWNNLGFPGVNAVQMEGTLYQGVCTCGLPIPGGTGCAIFNGSNDYLSLAVLDPSPYPPPTLTVAWWAKPVSTPAGEGVIISGFDNTQANGQYYALLSNYGAGHPQPAGGMFAGTGLNISQSNNPGAFGTWDHYAVVWNTTQNYPIAVYINGVSQPFTNSAVFGVFGPGGAHTQIGRNTVNGTLYDGKLADLRVWYATLTGSQIAAIAAGGVSGYVPEGSPVHWWPFNDASGGTAHDYGSGNKTATWSGSGAHWGTI